MTDTPYRPPLSPAAQTDGPAVPEGREPASVATQPSDRELLEEGPILEEVEELCEEHCFNVEGYESLECLQGLINDALARWGTPNQAEIRSSLGAATAPLPVPVLPDDALIIEPAEHTLLVPVAQPVPEAERLPGDQLCWWYEPDEDDDGSGYGGKWTLLRIRGGVSCYTHWLPATALPLPAVAGEP